METKEQMEQWLKDNGFELKQNVWRLRSFPINVTVWFTDDNQATVMAGRLEEEDWACIRHNLNEVTLQGAVVKTLEQYCLERTHFLEVANTVKNRLSKGINYQPVEDITRDVIRLT